MIIQATVHKQLKSRDSHGVSEQIDIVRHRFVSGVEWSGWGFVGEFTPIGGVVGTGNTNDGKKRKEGLLGKEKRRKEEKKERKRGKKERERKKLFGFVWVFKIRI